MKKALSLLPDALSGTGAKIIGCVHDEIILEVPDQNAEQAATILKEVMEKAGEMFLESVPVIADVSIAESWADK